MMRYSVQPRDLVFVKGYGFFSSSKRVIQKTAEKTGDLIGNEIAHNYKSFKKFTTK